MNKHVKHNLFLLSIAGVVVLMDQWTKTLVRNSLASGEVWAPIPSIGGFFRFTNWHNTGAAFGLFQNANTVLLILAIVIAIMIIVYYQQAITMDLLTRTALAMMFGGALGNMIDRVTQGYVTDFVAVGSFPVFNVADSSVTIGVGLLLLAFILQENREKKARQAVEQAGGSLPEKPEARDED